MPSSETTRTFYDTVASAYAEAFKDELAHKPFDRWALLRFADENLGKGRVGDIGCGPGHTTKFLADAGLDELIGLDLSPRMVEEAKKRHPDLNFRVCDMLRINFRKNSFRALLAQYAVVHFDDRQLNTFLKEAQRILMDDGQLLLSFHIGSETKHVDELVGVKAEADFCFFEVEPMLEALKATGFRIMDVITRHPYPEVEYQSLRAYILAVKIPVPDPFELMYAGLA